MADAVKLTKAQAKVLTAVLGFIYQAGDTIYVDRLHMVAHIELIADELVVIRHRGHGDDTA